MYQCIYGAIPSRECSVKAPAKWRNSVYVLTEICHQWSKWLGPWFTNRFSGKTWSQFSDFTSFLELQSINEICFVIRQRQIVQILLFPFTKFEKNIMNIKCKITAFIVFRLYYSLSYQSHFCYLCISPQSIL